MAILCLQFKLFFVLYYLRFCDYCSVKATRGTVAFIFYFTFQSSLLTIAKKFFVLYSFIKKRSFSIKNKFEI